MPAPKSPAAASTASLSRLPDSTEQGRELLRRERPRLAALQVAVQRERAEPRAQDAARHRALPLHQHAKFLAVRAERQHVVPAVARFSLRLKLAAAHLDST